MPAQNNMTGAITTPLFTALLLENEAADQAYWNWKPEAAYLWEFFQNFSH